MIFLVQILRKPENVSAWHPEKSGHDTLSMYKRACPRLGLSYLTPNGSTRLFQIIIWVIFQNVTSFWCTVLIWPDCPYCFTLCFTSIGKYESDDKCYNQLGCNVTTIRAIRAMAVTTKFRVRSVTTKLVVLEYF